MKWDNEDAYAEARSHAGAITDESVDDFEWTYETAYPTARIGVYEWESKRGKLMDKEEWTEWMKIEHEGIPERTYLGPNSLETRWLADPTQDPLVIVEPASGPAYLWDGHHRLAIAYMHELPTVPVFVGRPKVHKNSNRKLKAKLLR